MKIALSSKMKLDFVDGSTPRPAPTSSLISHWNRCNHMVISWLLNFVSFDIRNNTVCMDRAYSIWTELVVRYAQVIFLNCLIWERRLLNSLKIPWVLQLIIHDIRRWLMNWRVLPLDLNVIASNALVKSTLSLLFMIWIFN